MRLIRYLQSLSDEQVKTIERRFITASAISLIIATIFWYVYQVFANIPVVAYTDFRNIYTGAYSGLHDIRTNLYSLSSQFHIQQQFFPIITKQTYVLPFLTPPFMAIFLSPLALFAPSVGYVIWAVCNIIILLTLCYFTKKLFAHIRWQFQYLAVGMLLTFFPIWEALLQGQLSFLLMLSVFFGWYFMNQKKDFLGGFIASFLVIKPHFIFLLLIFLLLRRRTAFLGLITGLVLLGSISLAFVGVGGLVHYARFLMSISTWGESYGMHPKAENTWGGLLYAYLHAKSLSEIIIPWVIGITAAILLFIITFTKKNVFDLQWAFLIILLIFVGPHVFFHDMSLLAVSGVAILQYVFHHHVPIVQKRILLLLPLLLYVTAGIDFAFQWMHIWWHLLVWYEIVAMIILAVVIYKQGEPVSINAGM